MKLRKMRDRIGNLWVKYYPITIQQGVFDVETDETLDVTLTDIKNDITNKANHGYSEEEESKTLKDVDDSVSQLAGEVRQIEVEDAVQGAKIKDIENVLSTANLNQSAQLSVSGRKTISLPKNASNGGMQVKLEGLTAESLIVNGDFRNGLSSWEHKFAPTPTISSNVLSFTPTAMFGRIFQPLSFLSGIKYYISARIATSTRTSYYGTNAGVGQISLPNTSGVLTVFSNIITPTETQTNFQIVEKSGSEFGEIKVDTSYGIKVINLTDTFGAGNEPTKEECDLIFSDYFEGVKSFEPTGRVRSVGKNLFNGKWRVGKTYTAGVLTDSSTASVTELCRVNGATSYRFDWKDSLVNAIYQFDEERRYIPLDSSNTGTGRTVTTDANCRYIVLRLTTITPSTQEVRLTKSSTAILYEPYRETSLYLTAPELRSNGTVKDEIRKGANGYELVKRVGVGTSNGEIVTGGDFSDPTKWALSGTAIISNGTLKLNANAGIASTATQSKTITAGKIYRYKIDVLSLNGTAYIFIGNAPARTINIADVGKTISGFFLSSVGGNLIQLAKDLNTNASVEFDNISIFEYNTTDGVAIAGGAAVYGGNIHYTLATPVITPISYGGVLNSAGNGTVYHEPIIADAGVYDTKMDILLTDYPISALEEIIVHKDGIDTYLDVSTAVIAADKLSFTHPSLASGDLVLFTYAYNKETTNGNITATFYDSNVVKIDTVTGKAYRITDVITNGVLTRTITEV